MTKHGKRNNDARSAPRVEKLSALEKQELARQLRDDPEFMAGIHAGMRALRDGKVASWEDIRKELGL